MTMRFRQVVGGLFVVVAGLALLSSGVSQARAATPDSVEHIDDFKVQMTVARDGLLTVHETIRYNFGPNARHGIQRDLVLRETYGNDDTFTRLYRIDVQRLTADGSPVQAKEAKEGPFLRVRIGDPDQTITGVHTYDIDYTIRGALTSFDDHEELSWDAIGHGWAVPIDHASVNVTMPVAIPRIGCFAGGQGSRLRCDTATRQGARATFAQADLSLREGVTIVIAQPTGTIQPAPKPILEKKWNLDDAFARRANTVIPAAGLALLGVGGVLLVAWRRGRDRRFRGSAVDQAMGSVSGEDEVIAPFAKLEGPVEFVPPDGVRPGQVGVLIDETANLLDVTATIVDLAVRGYLRITELPPTGLFARKHDYQLERLDGAAPEHRALLPYERKVLLALFKTGGTVTLSDLKYKFRADLGKINDAMYTDAVKRQWFRVRPDRTRARWHGIGISLLVASGILTFFVARSTTYGLVALAGVLVALTLLACANRMPARTAKGSAALSRVRGFRRLFDEGNEDIRARFAEKHNIFSEYLPYAIVFGCTEKWAQAFEGLDAEALGTANWYAGNNGVFNAFVLASAMDDFGTVATGTMYASQPSSSSSSGFSGGGFSGGGGGGGGGSSW
jgi:uncharacterized membrane protein YgcG